MLGVLALPALLLIVLVIFLPNSPRWLAQKGRHVEAERGAAHARDTSEKAREELNGSVKPELKPGEAQSLFKTLAVVAVFISMLLPTIAVHQDNFIIMYYAPRVSSNRRDSPPPNSR